MGTQLTPFKRGGDFGDIFDLLEAGVVVNALGEQVSRPVNLSRRSNFSLIYRAVSVTGTPKVRVIAEESRDLDEDHFIVPRDPFTGAYASDIETLLTDLTAFAIQYVGAEASARITIGELDALEILYGGEEVTATVTVSGNVLTLSAPAGTVVATFDLTAAAYNTLTELVDAIDALGDWGCTLDAGMLGTELSVNLKDLVATSCLEALALVVNKCLYVEAPNSTGDENVGPGGKVFLDAYTTLRSFVKFIDDLTDWTCAADAGMNGVERPSDLKTLSATACKATAASPVIEIDRLKSLSLSPMRWVRFRFLGVSDNPADTVVTAKLFVQ